MTKYLRNFIGLLILVGSIYLLFFVPKTNRYRRSTISESSSKFEGADCDRLQKELILIKDNIENPDLKLIRWLESRLKKLECN